MIKSKWKCPECGKIEEHTDVIADLDYYPPICGPHYNDKGDEFYADMIQIKPNIEPTIRWREEWPL